MISKRAYKIGKSVFLIRKVFKRTMPAAIDRTLNNRYHKMIFRYVSRYCPKTEIVTTDFDIKNTNKTAWVLWWQGEENMPEIVKTTIASIKKHLSDFDVLIIDKNNIRNYVEIPEMFYNKLSEGRITLTHFSDILRFKLLEQYGGAWIDATVFVTKKPDASFFETPFYTFGEYENKHYFFPSLKWTGFFIMGAAHHPLFKFMCEFFEEYWKHEEYLVDYFLIDYGLCLAKQYNVGGFADFLKERTLKNPNLFKLQDRLNKPFNKECWSDLSKDTFAFKLSWRKNIHYTNKNNFYYNIVRQNSN